MKTMNLKQTAKTTLQENDGPTQQDRFDSVGNLTVQDSIAQIHSIVSSTLEARSPLDERQCLPNSNLTSSCSNEHAHLAPAIQNLGYPLSKAPAQNETSISSEQADCLSHNQLEIAITAILHKIGIPAHIKGYSYLRKAIYMAVMDRELINAVTKILYPEVAKYYRTTSFRVERSIRYAIEIAWNRGDPDTLQKYFDDAVSAGKPTNSEFIAMVVDILCAAN